MTILEEATWDQIVDEINKRYSDYLFCGVEAFPQGDCKEEGVFRTGVSGGYVAKRGLLTCLQETLEDERYYIKEMEDDDEL